MADLIAKSPCDGLLPLKIGVLTLTEADVGVMTSLSPFKGQEKTLSADLKQAHGMAAPGPNRATGKASARTIWFGQGVYLLIGPKPDASLAKSAALTDQSDAWSVVQLEGGGAEDVLARLVPVDLRRVNFKRGHTVRTQLGHMATSITRTGDASFQIMVFRSMAHTLVHELKTAMQGVAARAEV